MKYRPLKLQSGMDLLRSNVVSSCSHPFKSFVYNYETGKKECRDLPCGKCHYCLYQRQSEWVKRMEYESMPYINRNVYFFDLTYDKEYLNKDKEFRRELYSVKDDNGDYLPLLLNRKHLQLFFARLRRYTKKKFTYFACGEYGETYSRPHFHVVLWSNDVFTQADIEKAWSKNKMLIGLVQFNDLVANGTLYNLRSDSPYNPLYESSYAFKYVAKYVNKMNRDLFDTMYTKDKIKYAFHLYRIRKKVFQSPLNRDLTHNDSSKNRYRKKINQLFYENKDDFATFCKCPEGSQFETYKYETVEEWFNQFKPYTVCSKNPGIGTRYLEQYVQTEQDLFERKYDKFTGNPVLVPQSFKRKVLQKGAQILPCLGTDYRSSLQDFVSLNWLIERIRTKESLVGDEADRFNDWHGMLFSGLGKFYYVKPNGSVKQYDRGSGRFESMIEFEDFVKMLNVDHYLKYRINYAKEMNEYRYSKEDYIQKIKDIYFDDDSYQRFSDKERTDWKQNWSRRQKIWEFKHSGVF